MVAGYLDVGAFAAWAAFHDSSFKIGASFDGAIRVVAVIAYNLLHQLKCMHYAV